MLKNPYPPPTDDSNIPNCRFQTYIDPSDRALLMSLWPSKGTPQSVINNLILNICNDLRDLKLTSYHPDAADILAILVERRPLTDDQLTRLRRTSLSFSTEIPTWLQQHRGRSGVRKGTSDDAIGAHHTSGKATSRVERDREDQTSKTNKSKATTKTAHERGGNS